VEEMKIELNLSLEIIETLQGLISGNIGASHDNELKRQLKIVLKELDKALKKDHPKFGGKK
jgi:hypothetical protein